MGCRKVCISFANTHKLTFLKGCKNLFLQQPYSRGKVQNIQNMQNTQKLLSAKHILKIA